MKTKKIILIITLFCVCPNFTQSNWKNDSNLINKEIVMHNITSNNKIAIKAFWEWFTINELKIYNGIDNIEIREELFNQISILLNEVNPELEFEFSPILENGKREFIISANGIKDNFQSVIDLIENSPKIKNWEFIAFRQRLPDDYNQIQFKNIKLSYSDIFFRYLIEDDIVHIELNIKNYNESIDGYIPASFLLLDGLVGEYDVATKIGGIEWVELDESKIEYLSPFIELRGIIDSLKK